jgi:hypothetical protein
MKRISVTLKGIEKIIPAFSPLPQNGLKQQVFSVAETFLQSATTYFCNFPSN